MRKLPSSSLGYGRHLVSFRQRALRKWFWAIYWVGSDKGGISALRLSKLLDVSWPTAHRMLRKLRIAMGHRDSRYRLRDWIELDDALVGGKRSGQRGRGAEGKTPVLVACETRGEAGFLAMEVLESVSKAQVAAFATGRLMPEQTAFSDALPALNSLSETQLHCAEVTPPKQASRWLPWVHIAIANLKRFLLGTFHGVSAKLNSAIDLTDVGGKDSSPLACLISAWNTQQLN